MKDKTINLKKEDKTKKSFPPKNFKEKESSNVFKSSNKKIRIVFSWIAKDPKPPKKGFLWWLIASIIVIVSVIIAIIQKNWLFLAVILLGLFSYISMSQNKSWQYEIRVSDEGVDVGKKFLAYSQIRGFGFCVKRGNDFLVLETRNVTQRFLTIPLKVNKDKLGDFLIRYIPEKEYESGVMEELEDILKF